MPKFAKVAKWLICLFIVPALPFAIDWTLLFVSDPTVKSLKKLVTFWDKGEFLLLAIAMVATGFCDLSTSPPQVTHGQSSLWQFRLVIWARTAVLGCAFLIFASSLALYFAIASCVIHHAPYNIEFVTYGTPVIFVFSSLVGLACVVLSKET